ncbi:lasso peptide isopeptide bond-forming cyclase [Komarekiella sp. 'clone 1']|uniref:asparagine synthase (glutamine-hydrolyzing) n=1 Tax=Komarekiella delphini-convector SJRDD-AB1 TaxID=2593771 RepID=A0AA40SU52_9NOST|nr:lasso peptide isopeptide bond-forming cyclase [Komarekiella delphini-convector]MBD6615043.1 lasso peptide isopeptide bond-forming cyclase [Komarekiella delphini-convector SJRDD-AB1]
MSGIIGIYNLDGKLVNYQQLKDMVNILAHRGPDGSDAWCAGSVGLGHRMLWTTPESLLEKLPLVNQTEDLVITADLRIDNRDELIYTLQLNNYLPEKITDSQLVLAAYEKWGEQCPENLLGDFAFAIWDRQKQIIFCARDHFGIKPFYYYVSEKAFIFASEIKAIFCVPDVPRQINKVRIGDYLASMFHEADITSYKDIFRLPPAHRMTVSLEGIKLQSYWSIDPNRELRLGSDEEYAEAFREIFSKAVQCRLRSAFPIGSHLSGGLDSSSITCMARKLLAENGGRRLHTFSAVFDELAECDERPYINAVVAQGGLEPHYIKGDQISPLKNIDQMFWHQDEAFYAPNWSMSWALYEAIKAQGVRVVFDGFDGDNVVSDGYGYLSELARAGRWLSLAREIKELAKTFNVNFWRWLWSYVKQYGIKPAFSKYPPLRLFQRSWQAFTRLGSRQDNQSANQPAWSATLNAEFVQRVGLQERYQAWQKIQSNFGQNERERHYRNITQGLVSFAAEMQDKTCAAFSIEQRYPFWDKRLVEFCLSLPAEQKLHMGWNRVVMRRAMANILPVEVQWRRGKANFSPNLVHGLLSFERERLDKLILHNLGVLAEYIDVTDLKQTYQRFISSQSPTRGKDVHTIWIAVSLALWLQHYAQDRSNEFAGKGV